MQQHKGLVAFFTTHSVNISKSLLSTEQDPDCRENKNG